MEFIEVCKKREAVRDFKDEQVDIDIINKILEVGKLAPTAKNLQPHHIYVVRSKEGLAKIDKVRPGHYNAQTILLVCSDSSIAWTRADGYSSYEMDASIVATHLMLGATNYGVDNIWIESFDKNIIKEEFSLEENLEPICMLFLGYRKDTYPGNPMHNVRKDLSETVTYI